LNCRPSPTDATKAVAVIGADAGNALQPSRRFVRLGGALSNQFTADAVHGLQVLLSDGLGRDEAHAGPARRFADRLRVVGVVLLALDVRLDELRGINFTSCPIRLNARAQQ
jgi:hypothetical protein